MLIVSPVNDNYIVIMTEDGYIRNNSTNNTPGANVIPLISGNTFSWYFSGSSSSYGPPAQCNVTNKSYMYIAFG